MTINLTVQCLLLDRVDTLATLTEEERRLIREFFSDRTKDILKMPLALKRKLGCVEISNDDAG